MLNCPYCAESVPDETRVCPFCRSEIAARTDREGYRDRPGRQLAGVAVALAAASGLSVTLWRLAFIVLTFVSFLGPLLYAAFWLVLPYEAGGISPLGRASRVVVSEEPGAPAPLERFVGWVEPKLKAFERWIRGTKDSPEGSS